MNFEQKKYFTLLLLVIASTLHAQDSSDEDFDDATGLEIMQEVYKRHQQFAYIYEEQSMVMVDRNGDRDTRKIKRYSRAEENGAVKYLLLFESPDEINGVALLASRDIYGNTNKYIYLPAFGEQLVENLSSRKDGNFLGTDFSIENLVGEILDDYLYVRRSDKKSNNVEYFVIDVYRREGNLDENTFPTGKQPNRRHYISKNNIFITKTEYFDAQGNILKKQSHHDLKPVDNKMWRANMILMEDKKEHHQSLIKINRRVFSRDYVAEEIFTEEWLFKNYPFISSPDDGDEEFISENGDTETELEEQNSVSAEIDMEINQ